MHTLKIVVSKKLNEQNRLVSFRELKLKRRLQDKLGLSNNHVSIIVPGEDVANVSIIADNSIEKEDNAGGISIE